MDVLSAMLFAMMEGELNAASVVSQLTMIEGAVLLEALVVVAAVCL